MKILTPLTNSLDLGLSAVAAVVIHAVVLGAHFGAPSQAPVPRMQHVERCESITVLPKQSRARQVERKDDREKVVEERERTEPVERELCSRVETLRREPAPVRDRVEVEERMAVETEDRLTVEDGVEQSRTANRTAGREELDLSRTATPAVEDGYRFIYPRMARRRGIEGVPVLRVTVSAEGRVLDLRLVKSSGHGILDRSALKQMREMPFRPALDARGRPVESTVEQAVDFVFQEND